ncbi:MAG: threonylcarbamoyl-AMP synthase [Lachnospiraceae bacterium]|nr:threonylcarbamoyl-AMP synthase [Lachnospiraceae bacterium]
MMKTLIYKAEKEAFQRAGEVLKHGGIVAFPTDTVYGLGAVYTDDEAVRSIFRAKGRDEGKPLSILVEGPWQAEMVAAEVTDEAKALMERFWPGALTLILPKNNTVSDYVSAGGSTVGIRMPADETALGVIRAAGSPLAAPSANTSGKRSSVSAEDVRIDLEDKIDMIIDGGTCPIGISSTVLDLTGADIRILREGTVTREMIEETIGRRINDKQEAVMIAAGSDHAGFEMKNALIEHLKERGYEVKDFGCFSAESCDYPEYAKAVSEAVVSDEAQMGMLICGTGIGMSIAANKVKGIRAAVVSDEFSTQATREHNDANVICMGARVIDIPKAIKLLDIFLDTEFSNGVNHIRRIGKIEQ